jgi:hypothetical protein
MSKRRKIALLCSIVIALAIILMTAKAITDNALHNISEPTITASPDVTLKQPEPEIRAASEAKLSEPEPEITTEPAPPTAPTNIPYDAFVSTPQYVGPMPPYTGPQYPLRSPQQALSQPLVPSPVQPLPPAVTGPVEGLLEPLKPITDNLPILPDLVELVPLPAEDNVPALPIPNEVEIDVILP